MLVKSNNKDQIVGFINAGKDTTLDQVLELIAEDKVYVDVAELTDKETGETRTVAFIKRSE